MSSCCAPKNSAGGHSEPRDLTSQRWSQSLWMLSLAIFVAGSFLPSVRALFWSSGLIMAGVLCLANAARCRRLHCHITGPLFLLGGIVSALRGFGLLSWSWNSIGTVMVVGLAAAYLPECFAGKYVRGHQGTH